MRALKLLALLALVTLSVAVAAAQPAAEPQLDLQRTRILPGVAGPSAAAAQLDTAAAEYAIIQFGGPIAEPDRAALEATGVSVLEYLPDFAYLVRGAPAQLDAAAQAPNVYARLPFTAADKLAPALLRALSGGAGALGPVQVLPWPGQEAALAGQLRAAALRPTSPADRDALLRLAALPAARWIEPIGQPRLLNDVARKLMHVDTAWQARGLYGAGQTIAIADSGLDTGKPATLSPDFAGRLVATHIMAQNGDLADDYGHGTHVAGSVAGAGVQSGAKPAQHSYKGSFAGVAPEANLVIQAFEADIEGNLIGLDPDYYKLFAQAYADGARLHTDSWGDATGPASDPAAQFGGYPSTAQRTDQFVWDHPDMALFFAAGNAGRDGVPGGEYGFCMGGDGVVDPDSLLTPATAKNVVTVGASEGESTQGGYSQLLWVYFGGQKFCLSAEPIASDPIADNPRGMAAFSSRGPADDGRTKPDIVAPGTNIISNRSHYPNAGTLWGVYNNDYIYSGGTSMSTPLVTGSGALVRQWLVMRGLANPSAAAVKAVLLNTTYDIAPGQFGSAQREIPAARPNNVDGWGRADLAFLGAQQPYSLWVDDHTQGIGTGQAVDYSSSAARSLDVLDSSQPLRVMLAWTDPPASLSAGRQLVNDLDLVVTGPGNVVYRGNRAANGDRLNNVEGLVIDRPALGRYTIQVRGYNVPMQSQPYALAVGGALSNAGQLTLTKSATPAVEVAPGGLITYTLSLSANRAVAQPATISDALPAHTTFVSASNGGKLSNNVVQWSIAPFAAGATVVRTLVVRVDAKATPGAPIVNADYHAADGVDLQGDGAPVSVRVQGPSSAGGSAVYIPLARR